MAKTMDVRPLRVGAVQEDRPGQASSAALLITRRAAERLREGSVWVYRADVVELLPARGGAGIEPGSVVTVMEGRRALGSAIFSAASQITLRMVSDVAGLSREGYLVDVAQRVEDALRLRERVAPQSAESDSCRLIFSEADRLPGIVADRYNDLVVLQLLTQGTAQDDVREVVARVLAERLPGVRTVWERPDARIRVVEELGESPADALFVKDGEAAAETVFTINGLRFAFDAGAGQKTGAFLDQRLNYAAAAAVARGKALDVCTYQGGFALHLARVCERVTGIDASLAALRVADANLGRNAGLTAKVNWMEADAFDLLREYESTGKTYDTIVLDPPAFAKSKRAAEGAVRGYKELNLRALKMLAPGGTLVTCSCSHHVGLEEFTGVVAAAAVDAKRRVQVLETRGAAPDHPSVLGLAETAYLKCLICRVE